MSQPAQFKLTRLNQARLLILFTAILFSLISFGYFYHQGLTNIYGDGIAHLNIARKVVDLDEPSLWAHYQQLGSPWLPLPHLLMLPLIWQDYFWRTGLAGSIVSMISYLITVLLCFELGSSLGSAYRRDQPDGQDLLSGTLAAAICALNPSLLYLQTTPMTELPFLATTAIAIWLLLRWSITKKTGYLRLAGIAAAFATLTRYEAWALLPASALLISWLADRSIGYRLLTLLQWAVLAAIGPFYWLWHNWAIYGNALEFYNGYYSAKSIYQRMPERLGWTNFAVGHLPLALLLALAAVVACAGLLLCLISLFALARLVWLARDPVARRRLRSHSPLLLLLIPFSFTVYSIFTGNIQIYPLSALALLNVRYGLTAVLALSILPIIWLSNSAKQNLRAVMLAILIMLNYGWLISDGIEQLAIFQEPYRNMLNTRDAHARARLSAYLRAHPLASKTLIYSGEFAPVIIDAGISFRNTIFEGVSGWHLLDQQIPDNVQTIVVKEGDPLWQKLEPHREQLDQQFELIYQIEPSPRFQVWRRKQQQK